MAIVPVTGGSRTRPYADVFVFIGRDALGDPHTNTTEWQFRTFCFDKKTVVA